MDEKDRATEDPESRRLNEDGSDVEGHAYRHRSGAPKETTTDEDAPEVKARHFRLGASEDAKSRRT
jgi:hypothetical protein